MVLTMLKTRIRRLKHLVLVLLAAPVIAFAQGVDDVSSMLPETVDQRAQNLKKDVLDLNRDLFILEEELLYPPSTELVVFLSMDTGELFGLDSVELKVNDKTVAHYLYTERELDALRRGGVQRLYMGNVRTGKNELVAFFTGKGPHGRDFKRGTSLVVDKGSDPKYVELKIIGNTQKQQPEFATREW